MAVFEDVSPFLCFLCDQKAGQKFSMSTRDRCQESLMSKIGHLAFSCFSYVDACHFGVSSLPIPT